MWHTWMFALAGRSEWLAKWVRNWLTDDEISLLYAHAGAEFGEAVSYLYMGECGDFTERFERWAFWEAEYLRRGFKALSVDVLTEIGGHGRSLVDLLGKRRGEDEAPISHADRYRKRYLGKMPKGVLEGGFGPLIGEDGQPRVIIAQFRMPTTEDPDDK